MTDPTKGLFDLNVALLEARKIAGAEWKRTDNEKHRLMLEFVMNKLDVAWMDLQDEIVD